MTSDAYHGPLTDAEVDRICSAAGVTLAGLARVREVRISHPANSVDVVAGEVRVKGEFRSQKMGLTFDTRSIGGELPRAFEVDMDAHILEAWPHPEPIRGVRYIPRLGARPAVVSVRPTFLILEGQKVYYDIIVSGAALKAEVNSGSTRYLLQGSNWTSPPLAMALERFGIGVVITDLDKFSGHFLSNVALLHRAHFHSVQEVDIQKTKQVVSILDDQGWVSRRTLLERGILNADELNILVAAGLVYFPVRDEDYTDLPSTCVYRDRPSYELWRADRSTQPRDGPIRSASRPRSFDSFSLDGSSYTVLSIGPDDQLRGTTQEQTEVCFEGCDKTLRSLSLRTFLELERMGRIERNSFMGQAGVSTRPEDLLDAAFKIKVIRGDVAAVWPDTGHNPKRRGTRITNQTLDAWRIAAQKAKERGGCEIDGLVSRVRYRGNREKRLSDEVETVMCQSFDEFLGRQGVSPSLRQFKSDILLRCNAAGIDFPPSGRTVSKWFEKQDRCYLVARQKGPYARYETDGYVPREYRSRIIDTTLPFMLAHADHTPLPIKCPSVYGDYFYGRQLWYSTLVDSSMDLELSYLLSYDPPSSMTIVMLLLLCASHWSGFLPTFVATDNGADFGATHASNTLSEAEVHHLYRPIRCPRFGTLVELANNSLSQNLRALAGNTLAVKDFYRTSPGFKAKDVAYLTLPELSAHLTGFFESKFDEPGPDTRGMSRREFMASQFGRLEGNQVVQTGELGTLHAPRVTLNDDFIIRCMPYASHGGTRVVRAEGYVECGGLAYYGMGEGIRQYSGKRVYVKQDHFCSGRAWIAAPGGTWHECRNQFYDTLRHYTKNEAAEYIGYLRHTKVLKGNDPVANGAVFQRSACAADIPEQLAAARRCTRESLYATDAAIFINGDPLQDGRTTPAEAAGMLATSPGARLAPRPIRSVSIG